MILHKRHFFGRGYVVICWHRLLGDFVLNIFSISIERTSLSSLLVSDHLIFRWGGGGGGGGGRGGGGGGACFPQPESQNFFFF